MNNIQLSIREYHLSDYFLFRRSVGNTIYCTAINGKRALTSHSWCGCARAREALPQNRCMYRNCTTGIRVGSRPPKPLLVGLWSALAMGGIHAHLCGIFAIPSSLDPLDPSFLIFQDKKIYSERGYIG